MSRGSVACGGLLPSVVLRQLPSPECVEPGEGAPGAGEGRGKELQEEGCRVCTKAASSDVRHSLLDLCAVEVVGGSERSVRGEKEAVRPAGPHGRPGPARARGAESSQRASSAGPRDERCARTHASDTPWHVGGWKLKQSRT